MNEDEDEDSNDETLNVQSENFNPLSALYSKRLIIPFPSAPVLDNVAKASSLLAKNKNLDEEIHPKRKKQQAIPSTSQNLKTTVTQNEGLAKEVPSKNVLIQMAETKGPLAFLKSCMEKKIRVKVWTRGAREIKGYCLGFVSAFDKHWNLALEDVQEVWKRRVKRKTLLLGDPKEPPLAWKAMGPVVRPPKVTVTGVVKGKETCERRVNKMFMRGEQIAFISVANK